MRTRIHPETMLTAERLREVVEYDPETGGFVWRHSGHGNTRGHRAGGTSGLYERMWIDRQQYSSNRLAWLYVYGEWPDGLLDHIDEDKRNNRISNLRLATDAENKQNMTGSYGVTGCRGVTPHKGKFQAAIRVGGRSIYLGRYETAEEAHEAYLEAKRVHHPFWVER